MNAVVFSQSEEVDRVEVIDRFDFEHRCLGQLVPPRPCKQDWAPHPSPHGIRISKHPEGGHFEAGPYLEFEKVSQDKAHFQVMQEGRPTAFKVVLD